MNTPRLTLLTILLLLTVASYGQINYNQSVNQERFGDGLHIGEMIFTSNIPEKKLLGEPYWGANTMSAQLWLKGKEQVFQFENVNYNIYTNYFEITFDGSEKRGLKGQFVEKVSFKDSYGKDHLLINSDDLSFADEEDKKFGFYELLYQGNLTLLERKFIYIKKANYNTALMAGDQDDRIIIKNEFYLLDENNKTHYIKNKKELSRLIKIKKVSAKMETSELISFFEDNKL